MGKDSVLGHDPLSSIIPTNENKKSFSSEDMNVTDQNAIKNDQQTGSQTTVKHQTPLPTNHARTLNISKEQQSSDKVNSTSESTVTPKPKVVIGRMYEKPFTEKAKSVQHSEDIYPEERSYAGPSFSGSKAVQPIKSMESEINRVPYFTFTTSFFTYIVIAYTALMLFLGYFVYNDLSKRTSKIEARLFAIEKALNLKK